MIGASPRTLTWRPARAGAEPRADRQRQAVIVARIAIVATIVVGQLWALTIALDAYFEEEMTTVWWLLAFQAVSFLAFLVWWSRPRTDERRSSRAARSAIASLFPGSFALVMATGIVSIAAFQQGFEPSPASFAVNVAAYVVLWVLTIVRLVRFPGRVLDDMATPPARRRVPHDRRRDERAREPDRAAHVVDGRPRTVDRRVRALAGITYSFLTAVTVRAEKPPLEAGIGGAWLLLVVSTESIAVLGALVAPSVGATQGVLLVSILAHFVGLMLYVLVIGLIFYRWTFFPLSGEQVTPPYWINMGALAITALAGSNLVLAAGSWPVLERLVPFLTGTTLLAWGFATWWIPLLLAIGVWRHGVERVPIRYDPQYWSLVFPLGMYSVATFRLEAALDVGLPGDRRDGVLDRGRGVGGHRRRSGRDGPRPLPTLRSGVFDGDQRSARSVRPATAGRGDRRGLRVGSGHLGRVRRGSSRRSMARRAPVHTGGRYQPDPGAERSFRADAHAPAGVRTIAQVIAANIGAVAVFIGVVGGRPWLVAAGATAISTVVLVSYQRLRRLHRTALGARFGWVVRTYERAHGAFLFGALLGALVGAGALAGRWPARRGPATST